MRTKILCVFSFLGTLCFVQAKDMRVEENNIPSNIEILKEYYEHVYTSCATAHIMRIHQCDGSVDRVNMGVSDSPCDGVDGEFTIIVTNHYVECDYLS